jgi:hypothetical protein
MLGKGFEGDFINLVLQTVQFMNEWVGKGREGENCGQNMGGSKIATDSGQDFHL